jgi:hypothetical protein
VVGATKSAHLTVHLRFYGDNNTTITSTPFRLELWNPRNAAFHDGYQDGEAMRARLLQPGADDALFPFEMEDMRAFPFVRRRRPGAG